MGREKEICSLETMETDYSQRCSGKILNLHRRLDQATQTFVHLSMLTAQTIASPSEEIAQQLRQTEERLASMLQGVLRDVSQVYRGRVRIIPPGDGMMRRLENYNLQLEELERIVGIMMSECNLYQNNRDQGGVKMKNGKNIKGQGDVWTEQPCILVCGRAGAGKSTLVQTSSFDERHLFKRTCDADDFRILQTNFFTYLDCNGFLPGNGDVFHCFQKLRRMFPERGSNDIVQVWYCVSAENLKLTSAEMEMLQNADNKLVLVVTKTDLLTNVELDCLQTELESSIGWERFVFVSDSPEGTFPLEVKKVDAVSVVVDALTEEFNRLLETLDEQLCIDYQMETENCIQKHVARAMKSAVEGTNSIDIAKLLNCEMSLIREIGQCYDVSADEKTMERVLGCTSFLTTADLVHMLRPGAEGRFVSALIRALGKTATAYFQAKMDMPQKTLYTLFENTLKREMPEYNLVFVTA